MAKVAERAIQKFDLFERRLRTAWESRRGGVSEKGTREALSGGERRACGEGDAPYARETHGISAGRIEAKASTRE